MDSIAVKAIGVHIVLLSLVIASFAKNPASDVYLKIPAPSATGFSDGNNGHGNDPSGSDPSNPGNGNKSNKFKGDRAASVFDVLGISTDLGGDDPGTDSGHDEPPITPSTVSDDPFANITPAKNLTQESVENSTTRGAPVYGSIPLIRTDDASIRFLLGQLVADAQHSARADGRTPETIAKLEVAYFPYAFELAKTLSRLSQEEQNFVFYGRR